MNTIVEVATRFARALDAEDYLAAEGLLDSRCVYSCRGEVYRGRKAIVEAYRSTGDAASHDFDGIEYESSVTKTGEHTACIHFTDHLTHRDQRFTFACHQLVEISNDGSIARIDHVDHAGQREALREFMHRAGVRQPSDE